MPTCVEIFTGAGGLALGLEHAGFEHLLMVEYNRRACETIKRNRPDWPIVETDIKRVSFRPLAGQVDVLAGGPPCQPFSLGGKHKGSSDHRNMFPEAIRALREINPKMFFFENVRGLVRQSFLPYFEYIVFQLRYPEIVALDGETWQNHKARIANHAKKSHYGANYKVKWMVINAADYGTPQIRHRVIIWGVRSDLGVDAPDILASPSHSRESLEQALDTGEYWREHGLTRSAADDASDNVVAFSCFHRERRWRTLRDALVGLPEPIDGEEHPAFRNHIGIPGARVYKGHTGNRLDWPAKAVKAGDHGCPGGEHILIRDDGSIRYLTVRECARIQDFDDTWEFGCSRTEAMRQIGNAVPVKVATAFARSLFELLRKAEETERVTHGEAVFS